MGKRIIKKIVEGGVDFFKDKAVFKRGDYQWVVENNYCFLQERNRYKNIASCAVDDSHGGRPRALLRFAENCRAFTVLF